MPSRKSQSGFSVIELLLVAIIIVAIGLAGRWVYQRQHDAALSDSSQQSAANNVSAAPAIKSASDLDAALQTIDQNDPSTANASDSSQLDSQSSSF